MTTQSPITRRPDGTFAPGSIPNPLGRATKELDFADKAHAYGRTKCPYDPLGRAYIDYLIAQAWDDATDPAPKIRVPSREWLANRLWGLPRMPIDTRLEIDAHINADALMVALRPILEAQAAMVSNYLASNSTRMLLSSPDVQPPTQPDNPDLATE